MIKKRNIYKYVLTSLLTLVCLTGVAKNYTILDNGQTAGSMSISDIYKTNYITQTIQTYKTNIVTINQIVTLTNFYTVTNIVNVTPTNTPNISPVVILTSPANNSSYLSPANITISANASDSDGSISKIEFYSNNSLLNTDTFSPYSYNYSVNAGSYSIQAKAYDNSNAVALSLISSIIVTNGVTPTNPPTSGNSWYVKSNGGASSLSGKDWNNAWNINTINWGAVQPGDTIWVAGGTYSSGLNVAKSGNSSNYIKIKRVTSSDSTPVTATGWNSSFDSRVLINSGGPLSVYNSGNGVSYIIIDGRVDMGMRFTVSNGGGLPTSFNATKGNFITLTNCDLVGPNSSASQYSEGQSCGTSLVNFNGDSSGVNIGYGYNPNPGADNITITHCRVRGHANEFWFAGARNITIEHSKIYDNGAANSATWHGNLMIVNGSSGIIFRYNDVSNWQVEGLYPWGSVSRNWYVYGNVFHDGIGGKNGSTHRFLELRSYSGSITHGPFYVYNNTIVNVWAAITRGDTSVYWSSDSVVKNNLVYNVAGGGIGYLPSNNSNNLTASSNPFSDSAYRLSFTSQAKNAGVSLSPVSNHTLNIDKDGNIRGVDGTWDVGAFEE